MVQLYFTYKAPLASRVSACDAYYCYNWRVVCTSVHRKHSTFAMRCFNFAHLATGMIRLAQKSQVECLCIIVM